MLKHSTVIKFCNKEWVIKLSSKATNTIYCSDQGCKYMSITLTK